MSKNLVKCPQHPDSPFIKNLRTGNQLCSQCGLVVIDVGSELNNDKDSNKSRSNKFGSIKTIKLYEDIKRSLLNAYISIDLMSLRLKLPKHVRLRADLLYKQMDDVINVTNSSIDAFVPAIMYIACQQEGVPRTTKEICAVSWVSKKKIKKVFKPILKALGTSVDQITTGEFISRLCCYLLLPNMVQRAATHIVKKVVEYDIDDIVPGCSPTSVAAAAIFMASQASDEKRSQREIGEIAGIAEDTMKQSYKLILANAVLLFPEDFEFVTPISELPAP